VKFAVSTQKGPQLTSAARKAAEKAAEQGVTKFNVETQFPEGASELIRPVFARVIYAKKRHCGEADTIQDALSKRQLEIQKAREKIWNAERLLEWREKLRLSEVEQLIKQVLDGGTELENAQEFFWNLNVHDPVERARLRALEEAKWSAFKEQRNSARKRQEQAELEEIAKLRFAPQTPRVQVPVSERLGPIRTFNPESAGDKQVLTSESAQSVVVEYQAKKNKPGQEERRRRRAAQNREARKQRRVTPREERPPIGAPKTSKAVPEEDPDSAQGGVQEGSPIPTESGVVEAAAEETEAESGECSRESTPECRRPGRGGSESP